MHVGTFGIVILSDGRLVVVGYGSFCGVILTLARRLHKLIVEEFAAKQGNERRRRMCSSLLVNSLSIQADFFAHSVANVLDGKGTLAATVFGMRAVEPDLGLRPDDWNMYYITLQIESFIRQVHFSTPSTNSICLFQVRHTVTSSR